jgi:hypothetical protein
MRSSRPVRSTCARLVFFAPLLVTACLQEQTSTCSSGLLCPAGRACVEPLGACVAPGEEFLQAVWGDAEALWLATVRGTILHYDGESWTEAWVDRLTSRREIVGLWGSAPDDLFAIGERGLRLHFDGESWDVMAADNPETPRPLGDLGDIHGLGPNTVAAMSDILGGLTTYDGSSWSDVAFEAPGKGAVGVNALWVHAQT